MRESLKQAVEQYKAGTYQFTEDAPAVSPAPAQTSGGMRDSLKRAVEEYKAGTYRFVGEEPLQGDAPKQTEKTDPLIGAVAKTARAGKATVAAPGKNAPAEVQKLYERAQKNGGEVKRSRLEQGLSAAAAGLTQSVQGTVNALGSAAEGLAIAAKKNGKTSYGKGWYTTPGYQKQGEGLQTLADKLYGKADELQGQAQQMTAVAKEGKGKVGQFLTDVGTTGAQIIGDMAANVIAPGAGLAAMGVRAYGTSAQEARQNGATYGQQVAYGGLNALTEVLTEKMFGVFEGAYGRGILDNSKLVRAIGKAAGKLSGTTAGKILAGMGEEAVEEIVAGALEPAYQYIYGGEGYNEDTLSDIIEAAMIGGTLGGIGGAGNVIAAPRANAQSESTQNTAPNAAEQRTAQAAENLASAQEAPTEAQETAQNAAQVRNAEIPSIFNSSENANSSTQRIDNLGSARAENLAPVQENAPTGQENGLQPLSDHEIENLSSGKRNRVVKTINDAMDFIRNAVTNRQSNDRAYWGKIPQNTANRVLSDTGVDISGYNALTNGDAVRHIFKNHGDILLEEARNQIAVTDNDIALIPQIIAEYDSVRKSTKDNMGRDTLVFEKKIGNRYITVQAYVDGTKSLHTDTLYIKKEGSQDEVRNAQQTAAPALNVQDVPPQNLQVDGIVAQDADAVNNETLDNLGSAREGFDPLTVAELAYGTQDGGVNAVRPDDMPAAVDNGENVSRTAVSAKGAAVTPDEFVPLIESAVMDTKTPSGLRFMPITNDETVESAKQTIMRDGWTATYGKWREDNRAGVVSPEHTALGAILYNNAVNSGDTALAMDILSDYAASNRLTARALQAARILKDLTPDGRLYLIRRSIEKVTEDLGLPEGIEISEETQEEYRNAKTDEEVNAAIDKMAEEITAQFPSTFTDKINALRYTNMLGNFKTQVRNVAGNVGMQVMSGIKDNIAAVMERIFVPAEQRTKSLAVSRGLKDFAKADFADVEKAALGEAKYSLNERETTASDITRKAMDERTIFKYGDNALTRALGIQGKQGPGFKVLEAYRKATNYAMEKGDVIFSKRSYARAFAGWLKARGITEANVKDEAWRAKNADVLDEGRLYAIQQAQEATFRDSNQFSDWASRVFRGEKTPKIVSTALEGLLPFRRTPANVLVRAEEYSPLGIVNTLVKAAQAAKPGTQVTGADVIDQAAKALTGTGLFILGMMLRQKGLLRGGDDEDEKQRKFDDMTGHQPYSLELPNGVSYTLDWVTPGSIPLFMGVALEDARQEGGIELKDMEGALSSITDPMLEMSMLSGVNDLMEEKTYNDTNLIQRIATLGVSYLTQIFTNTLIGQLERTAEDTRMTTYVDKENPLPNWLQRQIGKASAKIPGWDYQQVEYVDPWGQTERGAGAAENLLSPGYVSQVEVTDVEAELQRLAEGTGNTSVYPAAAEKSMEADGEKIYFTAEEYTKYAKALGENRAKYYGEIIKSALYKNAADEDKADLISKAEAYSKYLAKKEMSDKFSGTKEMQSLDEAVKGGTSFTAYYEQKAKEAAEKEKKAAEKEAATAAMLKTVAKYGVTEKDLAGADRNGGGVNQAELYAYLNGRKLSDADKQIIWNAVGGWKTSYADYAKRQK